MIKENIFICRYQDDGPNGICGQAMSITMPWDKLHIFYNEDDLRTYIRSIEAGDFKTRKNPRITNCWHYDSEYGQHHASEVIMHEPKCIS